MLCALFTVVVVTGEVALAPASHPQPVIEITLVLGVTLCIVGVLVIRDVWQPGITFAAGGLMVLGVAVGVLLPDGLDAAAILPLTGAILTLLRRTKPQRLIFVIGYGASMTGEVITYAFGSMGNLVGSGHVPQSLAEAAVMLGFTYTLVWWVGDRWWAAASQAEHAMIGQRRLLEVNESLLSTLDPQGVLNLIADSLKQVVDYDNLTVYRIDRKQGVLRPVLARDRFAELIMDSTFPISTGVTGWVVKHCEAQLVNDSHLDSRAATIPGTPNEPESLIVVPLFVRGEVGGTLNMGRMGGAAAHFSKDEFELARLFAGQASIALQNAETHRAVWDRAETDALTSLHNRGAFDSRLESVVGNPMAQPCSLIMLDLADFKAYNDRHGHLAGDQVLKAVGRAINSAVRDRDLAFRYGGDEFAILLPRTDVEAAVLIAQRVSRAVAEMGPLDGRPLSVSAGVSCAEAHPATKTQLVESADAALYRAKAAGGGRIETCTDHEGPDLPEAAASR